MRPWRAPGGLPVLLAVALATRTAERRQGAMRIELLWSLGCRRLEIRYVGAARVAVLLDAGELVLLLVLPDRSPPCIDS